MNWFMSPHTSVWQQTTVAFGYNAVATKLVAPEALVCMTKCVYDGIYTCAIFQPWIVCRVECVLRLHSVFAVYLGTRMLKLHMETFCKVRRNWLVMRVPLSYEVFVIKGMTVWYKSWICVCLKTLLIRHTMWPYVTDHPIFEVSRKCYKAFTERAFKNKYARDIQAQCCILYVRSTRNSAKEK